MMQEILPFSQACERNKKPIMCILNQYCQSGCNVLEIGSGTGQHIEYFSLEREDVIWQPSDRAENLHALKTRCDHNQRANCLEPISLDVSEPSTHPKKVYHLIFSANTAHIMSWSSVEDMLSLVGNALLASSGYFLLYGPFIYDGAYTSESNEIFDASLKARSDIMGLREINDIKRCAKAQRLRWVEGIQMPANNQILVFQRL